MTARRSALAGEQITGPLRRFRRWAYDRDDVYREVCQRQSGCGGDCAPRSRRGASATAEIGDQTARRDLQLIAGRVASAGSGHLVTIACLVEADWSLQASDRDALRSRTGAGRRPRWPLLPPR